jgi:hypothetical protein
VTSQPVTSRPVTLRPVTSRSVTSRPVTFRPVTFRLQSLPIVIPNGLSREESAFWRAAIRNTTNVERHGFGFIACSERSERLELEAFYAASEPRAEILSLGEGGRRPGATAIALTILSFRAQRGICFCRMMNYPALRRRRERADHPPHHTSNVCRGRAALQGRVRSINNFTRFSAGTRFQRMWRGMALVL